MAEGVGEVLPDELRKKWAGVSDGDDNDGDEADALGGATSADGTAPARNPLSTPGHDDAAKRFGPAPTDDYENGEDEDYHDNGRDSDSDLSSVSSERDFTACSASKCGYCGHCRS